MKIYGMEVDLQAFLTYAPDEGEWSASRLGSFAPKYPLDRKLGELQNWYGRGDDEQISPYGPTDYIQHVNDDMCMCVCVCVCVPARMPSTLNTCICGKKKKSCPCAVVTLINKKKDFVIRTCFNNIFMGN
jgi:hypothetical protein